MHNTSSSGVETQKDTEALKELRRALVSADHHILPRNCALGARFRAEGGGGRGSRRWPLKFKTNKENLTLNKI